MDSKDTQVLLAQETGMIPTIKAAAQDESLKKVWYLQPFIDQLETAYSRTPSANWGKINDVLNAAFESAFRGKATAQQALDKAAGQIDQLLQNK